MLVAPTRECVLLDLLPWRVLGEIFLCSGHVCVLVRGERSVGLGSGGGARLVGACVLTHFYRLWSPALIRCLAFWVESCGIVQFVCSSFQSYVTRRENKELNEIRLKYTCVWLHLCLSSTSRPTWTFSNIYSIKLVQFLRSCWMKVSLI